eukprot:CAMPEP_0182599376 /NCGR_PEP_ID=MMETSP1324-20130603/90257_1 /TAXON_ID=236786 /ORGANISM="Florenciella sp., Strain RCC1587" /LENGTH=102 /DNA_ID=CAMNT_0024817267 /DNA_START=1 /DNA_END=305 /DNA_ORIENTATION=-
MHHLLMETHLSSCAEVPMRKPAFPVNNEVEEALFGWYTSQEVSLVHQREPIPPTIVMIQRIVRDGLGTVDWLDSLMHQDHTVAWARRFDRAAYSASVHRFVV